VVDGRPVHRRGLAVGFGFWLVEVSVPVDEQQPVTATTPQRQQIAENDRAVATEHDRDVVGIEHPAGRVCERVRVVP
jgi:hypothetical protein